MGISIILLLERMSISLRVFFIVFFNPQSTTPTIGYYAKIKIPLSIIWVNKYNFYIKMIKKTLVHQQQQQHKQKYNEDIRNIDINMGMTFKDWK